MANGLDHFYADELVVLTVELTIVFFQQRDFVGEPQRLDFCPRILVLLLRYRRCGNAATVVCGGVNGKAAPAGADFYYLVRLSEIQLPADPVELRDRGVFQRS